MRANHGRVALFAGVSVAALGAAAPAYAGTTVTPGTAHVVTGSNVSDTLTICNIGDTCKSGEISSDWSISLVRMNSTATGQIRQVGQATGVAPAAGNDDLHMSNAGSALVQAAASGNPSLAIASLTSGIAQFGSGGGNVTIDLSNTGAAEVLAHASARTIAESIATSAFRQLANASLAAKASQTNAAGAHLVAGATAAAIGSRGSAFAFNVMPDRVSAAGGTQASVSLKNGGTIDVHALATGTATAGAGGADAWIVLGLDLQATAGGSAVVSATNVGTLDVSVKATGKARDHAHAFAIDFSPLEVARGTDAKAVFENQAGAQISASGDAAASGASAQATAIAGGMRQQAFQNGAGSVAQDHFVNAGTFDVAAIARAEATGANGSAVAVGFANGVSQLADGGVIGDASYVNDGTFNLQSNAKSKSLSRALARATALGIEQVASATTGAAMASVTNNGHLGLAASASALGGSAASATANNTYGIRQTATAAGAASANLTNGGSVAITVNAQATAAHALANVTAGKGAGYWSGIQPGTAAVQQSATGTSASLIVQNTGTFAIHANAAAQASSSAAANARLAVGIQQVSYGSKAATASLQNIGTMDVTAVADASASGHASAVAEIGATATSFFGIGEYLSGAGIDQMVSGASASASLHNQGTLDLAANANALGAAADAKGAVAQAIYQEALGGSGGAPVSLVNGGTLKISAIASATASQGAANAVAHVGAIKDFYFSTGGGIYQAASATDGGDATVTLANTASAGTVHGAGAAATTTGAYTAHITMAATAVAHGVTQAHASAFARNGFIHQQASAGSGNAFASIDNAGAISLDLSASAEATGLAHGTAAVQYGLYQRASGTTALIQLNDLAGASIDIGEAAFASGSQALAYAYGGNGFLQQAKGGSATASINNAGTITTDARATAIASGRAVAGAAAGGIWQDVNATSAGLASLANSGSLAIKGAAKAAGRTAEANAGGGGISQTLHGASALLTNNGSITMAATATALAFAGSAEVGAGVNGIHQSGFAASEAINNSGTMQISAIARAAASATARANAGAGSYGGYIVQRATLNGGSVSALIQNSGTINVNATASAVGGGQAYVSAQDEGISQNPFAWSGGSAAASLVNSGAINVQGAARAGAIGGFAVAALQISTAVRQIAYGSDAASASLTNSGTINTHGTAVAVGASAASAMVFGGGIGQTAHANASENVTFANSGSIAIELSASAQADRARAAAGADLLVQSARDVSASNGGTLSIAADANAVARTGAAAARAVASGVFQYASETRAYKTSHTVATSHGHSTVSVWHVPQISQSLSNTGAINLAASVGATAAGKATVTAGADGGIQQRGTGDAASLSITNSGTINATANASAKGSSAWADARVGLAASQRASADPIATAFATYPLVLFPGFTIHLSYPTSAKVGDALAAVTNSGSITVDATVSAVAAEHAVADASAAGVGQSANAHPFLVGNFFTGTTASLSLVGGDASAKLTNSGSISVIGNADANGQDGLAHAAANAISQYADAPVGSGSLNVTNSGRITASALAHAVGVHVNGAVATATTSGTARATANASGVRQNIVAASGSANITNSGSLDVTAKATATASSSADAKARATGILQSTYRAGLNQPAPVTFANSGTIDVAAVAKANAATGRATASAVGYTAIGGWGGNESASVSNSGTLNVSVSATATGEASAKAQGISVANAATTTGHVTMTASGGFSVVQAVHGQPLLAHITNSGALNVVANAFGMSPTQTPVGAAATAVVNTHQHSVATATGIRLAAGAYTTTHVTTRPAGTPTTVVGNTSITNSGTINVDAVTAKGGSATAYGIRVVGNGAAAPAGAGDIVITNGGGTIRVRQSANGRTSWRRGMAIDVSAAPNNSVINLLGGSGGGNIYGDIALHAGDVINIQNGKTLFDGIINPASMPAGKVTAADFDMGLTGPGTLNVNNGGNLELVSHNPTLTMDNGPSFAFVDTLNLGSTGTLTYDLAPTAGGTQPAGTYPQIFADTANLSGTLVANVTTPGGLFADSYLWKNVIDATVRNGTFNGCLLGGPNAGSIFVTTACTYDAQGNVDLGLSRVAFNRIAGLTPNELSLGGGLECIYSEVGPAALRGTTTGSLFSQLFTVTSPTTYAAAVNQLTGATYAGYLQSFNSLGYHYNTLLDRATDCDVPTIAGSALACRTSPMRLWAQFDYDNLHHKGDMNLSEYHADRWSALIGFDANVARDAVLGISGGHVWNDVNYRNFAGEVKSDGWQAGAYGVFDPGAFYVKALGTYSWFDTANAHRSIDWRGFGFGTLSGSISSHPNVNLWTLGLHAGYRIPISPVNMVTPFVNYDYTDAKLKSFTESGVLGANLAVNGGSAKHSWLTGGLKWAGQIRELVPEVSVAWRHMFGKRTESFNANFADDLNNCDFDISSMREKRDAALLGLSIGGNVGAVNVRIGYEGAFSHSYTENSGFVKLVVPLGGHAAPPPPPPAAPPPPPPPPAMQTCADGSVLPAAAGCPAPSLPPPPPPSPQPERG